MERGSLRMEEQLLPQYPVVMACFFTQAIKSGLKDGGPELAKSAELRSTCCLDNRERSLNLLPPEVDKATSPGAGDNMPTIVRVWERDDTLSGATTLGISHRIPRMPRATGFNYSRRGGSVRRE